MSGGWSAPIFGLILLDIGFVSWMNREYERLMSERRLAYIEEMNRLGWWVDVIPIRPIDVPLWERVRELLSR